MLAHVHAGVSVHQYSSWAGVRDLCGSEDPSGNLDRPLSGGPPPAGQTAVWSCQEHKTPVGGKKGVKGAELEYHIRCHIHTEKHLQMNIKGTTNVFDE